MILPAMGRLQTTREHLDFRLGPENTPEKVQRLLDGMQSIIYRLQSLEMAHDRITRHSWRVPDSFLPLSHQVQEAFRQIFEHWASLKSGDEREQMRGSLQDLSRDWKEQFDAWEANRDRDFTSDRLLTDLYTLLGSLRGLAEAMSSAQVVISQINWQQWATARF
jgi:hypothetical protein